MFKKEILVGHSEDTVVAIIEHLERSNVPFEVGIKDIFKRSSERFSSENNDEEYEAFYTVEVRKKYAEQVEAIVAQYVSQEDVKHWYKVSKKQNRKLEWKEKALFIFMSFIYFIAILAIETGKEFGKDVDIVLYIAYIACALFLMSGVFITIKYYKEMQKQTGDLRWTSKMFVIVGICLIFKAIFAFANLLRNL
ncbi:hypothetical protein [Lysinibacillus sp. NPDC092081]|uniref:hypothetical protein n=1 Tax=Lysinibacillus sp. NPDC092081 TaxID=3364131 RepID=UPI003816CF40